MQAASPSNNDVTYPTKAESNQKRTKAPKLVKQEELHYGCMNLEPTGVYGTDAQGTPLIVCLFFQVFLSWMALHTRCFVVMVCHACTTLSTYARMQCRLCTFRVFSAARHVPRHSPITFRWLNV